MTPTMNTPTTSSGTSTNRPADAIAIEKILESMEIKEFEPLVVQQLLELIYRYVTDVFQDARVYMDHAGRETLDLEDARLAIQSRVNFSFTEPPPVEFLLEIASKRNAQALPLLPEIPTVLLPSPQNCLAAPNYQVFGSRPHSSSSSSSSSSSVQPPRISNQLQQLQPTPSTSTSTTAAPMQLGK